MPACADRVGGDDRGDRFDGGATRERPGPAGRRGRPGRRPARVYRRSPVMRAAGEIDNQINKSARNCSFRQSAPRGSLMGVAVRPPSRKGSRNARQGQRRRPPKCARHNRSPIRAGRARPPPLGASLPPCGGGSGRGVGRTFPNVSRVVKPKFQWPARPPTPALPHKDPTTGEGALRRRRRHSPSVERREKREHE